jgi:hypothetical protein
MPFTISHAAVVLPFSRLLVRWRLLSAVVIGAMVPDFGLFLPWRLHRFETHSAVGLFTFCLPVGLAGYWIFQYLIKTPVLEVLPDGAYARWRPFSSPAAFASIRQWLLAACGVFAGAVTHLVWDSFTHYGARGVRMIPWLEDPVYIGSHHMAELKLMQDGTSLIGLAVVLAFVCYGLRRGHEQLAPTRPLRPWERRAWVLAWTLAALVSSAAWLLWMRGGDPTGHSFRGLNGMAVATLRGLATALLCGSLALSWRLRALRLSSAHRTP